MSKCNVGRYNIDQFGDGTWTIQWQDDDKTSHQICMRDLEQFFDNIVRPHQEQLVLFLKYFILGMTDMDKFFALENAHKLIDLLPNEDEIPLHSLNLQEIDRYHWHLKSFIEAYARMTGVRLPYYEVDAELNDFKQMYVKE